MNARHSLAFFVLVCAAALPVGSALASASLTGTLAAYRVATTDQGVEEFLPADNARPGDLIEYRLVYSNAGDQPIQNILITDPVPIGTRLDPPSASKPETGRVEFSIDGGKQFQPWPILLKSRAPDGSEKLTEAKPEMVTHVRWGLEGAIPPEGEITLKYRTVIK